MECCKPITFALVLCCTSAETLETKGPKIGSKVQKARTSERRSWGPAEGGKNGNQQLEGTLEQGPPLFRVKATGDGTANTPEKLYRKGKESFVDFTRVCLQSYSMLKSSSSLRCETLLMAEDHTLEKLVQLVNDAYDVAEHGMWKVKGFRTNFAQIKNLISNKELIVAIENQVIIGCVKVQKVQADLGEFGMLVVDPLFRGKGVGRELIHCAEQRALGQGCTKMRLELLIPRNWKQPTKEFNKLWYTRLGYSRVSTEPFERDFPELKALLATECDYTIWHKDLCV